MTDRQFISTPRVWSPHFSDQSYATDDDELSRKNSNTRCCNIRATNGRVTYCQVIGAPCRRAIVDDRHCNYSAAMRNVDRTACIGAVQSIKL